MATLVVDCGGLGLKAALFDEAGQLLGERIRRDTPYPLSPQRLADTITRIGADLEKRANRDSQLARSTADVPPRTSPIPLNTATPTNSSETTQLFQSPQLQKTITQRIQLQSPQRFVADPSNPLHFKPYQDFKPYPVSKPYSDLDPYQPHYEIDRVTVGMPGMIRRGKVVYTPHYINVAGPHTEVVPELAEQWAGCDIEQLIAQRLGVPVKVVNDAELHGLGVITGSGSELVLTFGTGLGTAWFDDGALAPHLEMSHAPVRIGEMVLGAGRKPNLTYDQFIGDHELQRLGPDHWSDRVLAVVDSLQPVFQWDRLYLGGGNAANIAPWAIARMPTNVAIVPNESALTGGLRVWGLG